MRRLSSLLFIVLMAILLVLIVRGCTELLVK